MVYSYGNAYRECGGSEKKSKCYAASRLYLYMFYDVVIEMTTYVCSLAIYSVFFIVVVMVVGGDCISYHVVVVVMGCCFGGYWLLVFLSCPSTSVKCSLRLKI